MSVVTTQRERAPAPRLAMDGVTIHQLRCFDAVVTEGGFQAAAAKLGRSHPAVFAAVKTLEGQLGLVLLDRGGYRVGLTEAGRSFHRQARVFLGELGTLRDHAAQLAIGEESELRVVIGDLCPLNEVLGLLRRFFGDCPATRLHLHFEAISGPWERLFDDEADLIIHHIDRSDPRLEFIDLCSVRLAPVVAPGFLDFPVSSTITPERMRRYVQCVIRDTARHSPPRSYHLIEGARSWTVGDQLMKKEVILQGMGWGHMPTFLIAKELEQGRLLSIAGRHLPGSSVELTAARRRDRVHGRIADRLWRFLEEQAPGLRAGMRATDDRTRTRRRPARRREATPWRREPR
jgi:DNA-binding transcriptional LysR family regulator